MQALIAEKQAEIAAVCRRYRVRRLEVFGSAARDDFDPARSDVDLLVEFEEAPGLREYFGLKEELEAVLGRSVDLVMPGAIRNPYLRAGIEQDRELLFAA